MFILGYFKTAQKTSRDVLGQFGHHGYLEDELSLQSDPSELCWLHYPLPKEDSDLPGLDFSCCYLVSQLCPTLWPCGLQHARLPCPSLSPGVCLNSCPLSWWYHPTISSSVAPFSCPQSFPASRTFQMDFRFLGNSITTSPGPPQAAGLRNALQLTFSTKYLWLLAGFPRFGQVRDLDSLQAYLQSTAHPRLSKQPVISVCPLIWVLQGHNHRQRAISSQMTVLMDVVCSFSLLEGKLISFLSPRNA